MSDFLTRLVMHAGRAVDVIRPRPLSRFEAPPRASHESTEDEIARPVPRQSRTLVVTADDETERRRTVPEVPAKRDAVPMPEARARDSRSPAGRSVAQSPHPTVKVDPAVAMRPAETRPATQPETIRHETTHTITKIVEQVVRPEERSHGGLDDGIRSRTGGELKIADRLAPLAPTHSRAAFVKPAVVEAATRGARQPPVPPIPEIAATGGLTVEITIGRVDVRAVMPTAPKSRESRSSKPELSLDDYLQQRGRRT
jgi:hypothetical protein